MAKPKIVILGTGGTIAGQADASTQGVGYRAGKITVQSLLQAVPDLPQLAAGRTGAVLDAVQLAQIDSKDMDWNVWRILLQTVQKALADEDTQALVITHGTDTLEETAWLLQAALQPAKPVILTCAMRPATSLQADGPQNLRDAVAVAASGVAGVWVVAAGQAHSAEQVLKVHPYRLDAFRSYESGPCAYIEEGRVRWLAAEPAKAAWPVPDIERLLNLNALPWVEVVQSGALQSAHAVQALLAAGVQGLVVAGTGNGTVHQEMHQALQQARSQGVAIWLTTRCLEGQVVAEQSALAADGAFVIKATDAQSLDLVHLPPSKARVALMLQLALKG